VSKKRGRSIAFWVYGGSLVFHAVLALGTIAMPKPRTSQTTAITLLEEKKKAEPKKAPPPPPPPPKEDKPKPKHQPQQQQAKVAPETKQEATPPPPVPVDNAGFADLGMSLGNSDGPGVAIPVAGAAAAAANEAKGAAAPTATTHKVAQLEAPTQGAAACSDPVVKPKSKGIISPKYTMQARQAEIEGVVRVRVTVDETGHVINAAVVSGLGYGLDEAALAAARATTFTPASQCGKPVVGSTILAFRFEQE